jgi:hypothetical protein
MMKLAAVGALGLIASCLFGQGNNTGGQSKDDWEEINFEFNSSILSDGYPSLLRLAEMLGQHRDYHVKVTGHTDYVGSAQYNDKLAQRRADAVKEFLVHYGASASQITTAGDGKRAPEVDNRTKEGRFMNRRVVLAVTDGTGKLIKEGPISEVGPALDKTLQDFMKRQEECCAQILKRLDKLDDILAALKNMQGENDKLRADLNQLRNEHNALRDQINGLPKPITEQQAQTIANNALDEAQRRNRKFSLVGLNIGPTYGEGRTGDFTFSGRGQFFSPFGGTGRSAVQAQGEFMYYPGRKEGQFDIGLVNRFAHNWQAGGFGSFKAVDFSQYQNAGWMGQAAFLLDYVSNDGRFGIFVTRGFKNYAILNQVQFLAPGVYMQTFARVVNQQGINFLFRAWGNAYFQGDAAYLKMRETPKNARPGINLKLVQPINEHVAFTAEGSYNETLTNLGGSGRFVVGVEVGNFFHPKDYAASNNPVPMDVPRIRYEIGQRRVGSAAPVADAGANQLGIPAGTVTLNGSGSYDPLGEALSYQWTQLSGPSVQLSNPTGVTTTFTAAAGQTYIFRLTVTNTDKLSSSASTTVSTVSPQAPQIIQFTGSPASIQSGQSSTLTWVVQNATSVSISPTVGNVDPRSGSVSVSPTANTTYTLTATNANGTTTATQTIAVGTGGVTTGPQIVRFEANPVSIQPGQSSTLSWATNGASTVTIDNGVGNVALNGSTVVHPTQTTTYTLTATSSDGRSVTVPVTVIVSTGTIPQVVVFTANPPAISAGQSTKLCWQVNNATNITISPGVGTNLNANDCATVSPTTTTTYTLTATNAAGQIQANTTVTVGQVQILSFTANPVTSTAAGNPVVLSWQTANATSVVLIGAELPPQTLPLNGSLTVNPITNSTYTLTAYGPGGQTVSVTISVFVR